MPGSCTDLGLDRPHTSKRRKQNPQIPSFNAQDADSTAEPEDEDAANLAEWYRHQRMAGSGKNQYSTRYNLLNVLLAVEKQTRAPQSQSKLFRSEFTPTNHPDNIRTVPRRSTRKK